ncbi:MAG: XdhC family protein [Sphingobacteriales bacterium]|nr:XdhC family protein [Sphingobacteriales bacterium]
MKEIKQIIEQYDKAVAEGRQTALATVVHVEGSSYRRPGARMLIEEDGRLTGAISGGCLEGDALRKALLVMHEKKSRLVTYDTMDDDDAKFGVGLGCNGIIQVLIEPIDSADPYNSIVFLKTLNKKRQKSVLVTLFNLEDKKNPQPGTCLLINGDETVIENGPVINDRLIADAKKSLISRQSSFINYVSEEIDLTAFIEFINPPVSLVIIGAGNDVMPVVEMAEILGWETTVVDGRANYAAKDRFASTCRVLVAKPEQAIEKISIDELTFFLLMTHNYNYDMAILRQLLQKKVTYIGMLGPKKKKDRILSELKENGFEYSDEQLSVLHSPVGLDIGAETPEEIALSIMAEIKSVLASRNPEPLTKKNDPIHHRSHLTIEKAITKPG